MNRNLFTIILFFVFKTSFAQPYSHYVNHTSKWCCQNMYSFPFLTITHFTYSVDGDTTISGLDYFKIHKYGIDTSFYLGNVQDVDTINIYAGALREDAGKRFYFIYPFTSQEKLLFDFDLYPGMPVGYIFSNDFCPGNWVVSVDTLLLGTEVRKQFHLNNSMTIVEGVGGLGGLIEGDATCITLDQATYLICYEKDGQQVTINPSFPCEFLDGINENENSQFSISPNPSSSTIKVLFSHSIAADISLSDIHGKLLITKSIRDAFVDLYVSDIESGIYFITIKSSEGVFSRKVIIQH
jgi:hypothetical protein